MFSSEFCKISKNIFFTEHLLATAFELINFAVTVSMVFFVIYFVIRLTLFTWILKNDWF